MAGPGNNLERLPVCIGKCYTVLLTVKPATCDSGVILYQVYTTCTTYTAYADQLYHTPYGNPYFGDTCQSLFSGCSLQLLHVHKGTTVIFNVCFVLETTRYFITPDTSYSSS